MLNKKNNAAFFVDLYLNPNLSHIFQLEISELNSLNDPCKKFIELKGKNKISENLNIAIKNLEKYFFHLYEINKEEKDKLFSKEFISFIEEHLNKNNQKNIDYKIQLAKLIYFLIDLRLNVRTYIIKCDQKQLHTNNKKQIFSNNEIIKCYNFFFNKSISNNKLELDHILSIFSIFLNYKIIRYFFPQCSKKIQEVKTNLNNFNYPIFEWDNDSNYCKLLVINLKKLIYNYQEINTKYNETYNQFKNNLSNKENQYFINILRDLDLKKKRMHNSIINNISYIFNFHILKINNNNKNNKNNKFILTNITENNYEDMQDIIFSYLSLPNKKYKKMQKNNLLEINNNTKEYKYISTKWIINNLFKEIDYKNIDIDEFINIITNFNKFENCINEFKATSIDKSKSSNNENINELKKEKNDPLYMFKKIYYDAKNNQNDLVWLLKVSKYFCKIENKINVDNKWKEFSSKRYEYNNIFLKKAILNNNLNNNENKNNQDNNDDWKKKIKNKELIKLYKEIVEFINKNNNQCKYDIDSETIKDECIKSDDELNKILQEKDKEKLSKSIKKWWDYISYFIRKEINKNHNINQNFLTKKNFHYLLESILNKEITNKEDLYDKLKKWINEYDTQNKLKEIIKKDNWKELICYEIFIKKMSNQNQNNAFSTLDKLMELIKSQNNNKIKNSKTLLIINKIKKIKKDELKAENSNLLFLLRNIPSKYLKIILDTFNKLKFELDDEGFQKLIDYYEDEIYKNIDDSNKLNRHTTDRISNFENAMRKFYDKYENEKNSKRS